MVESQKDDPQGNLCGAPEAVWGLLRIQHNADFQAEAKTQGDEEMSNCGYFLVHRKFLDDWKWQMPYRGAWLWMMAKARWAEYEGLQRGQLRFSVSWAPKEWGMSVTAARNFLRRCENEKDKDGKPDPCILWQRGKGGHIQHSTRDVPGYVLGYGNSDVQCDVTGLITILKYDEYQPSLTEVCDVQCDVPGYVPNVAGGYLLKEEEKEVQKEKKKHVRKSAGRPKTVEEVQEELAGICIADFERTWGPTGLDVIACFDNFCEFCLGKAPSKPVINAGKYFKGHFSQAFTNACKRADEKGWYRLKIEQPQELTYEEIAEQRRKARETNSRNTET